MRHKNELFFVGYLFCFGFTMFLNAVAPEATFIVRALVAITAIMMSSFPTIRVNVYLLTYVWLVFVIFFLEMAFRPNTLTSVYFYNFIINGAIPVYLLMQLDNMKMVLKYFTSFSVPLFLIYMLDPFFNYALTFDYMTFGFEVALPSFCGFHIGRKVFGYRWMIIPEVLSIISLFIFSNRGALLAALAFAFLLAIIDDSSQPTKILRFGAIIVIIAVVFINAVPIIDFILKQIAKWNYYSYSLHAFRNMLVSGVSKGLAGRDMLWSNAWEYFKASPLLGNGVGSFTNHYGNYPHNLILDILTSFGIIGFLVFLLTWLRPISLMFTSHYSLRVFLALVCCLSFVPLLTSSVLYANIYFWLFIALGLRGQSIRAGEA